MTDSEQRSETQDALIVEVRDRLKENNKLISIGNTVTTKIADTLRLDWFRKLGSELKSLMERIFTAIYKAVVALQAGLRCSRGQSFLPARLFSPKWLGRIKSLPCMRDNIAKRTLPPLLKQTLIARLGGHGNPRTP